MLLLSVLSVVRAIVSLGIVRARVCLISGLLLLLLGSIRVFRAIVCADVVCVNVMGCCIKVMCSLVLLVIHGVCRCVCII